MKRLFLGALIATFMVNGIADINASIKVKKVNTKLPSEYNFNEIEESIEKRYNEYLAEQEKIEKEKKLKDLKRRKNVNFDVNNISIPSGITKDEMYAILKDTGMHDVAGHIVEGEKQYGINALLLAALVAEESGWGKSPRATGPTKNMTGYAVNNNQSVGKTYSHRGDSVLDSAKLLRDYITPGGKYDVKGKSLKKVGNLYCAVSGYDERLTIIAKGLLKKYRKIHLGE